MIGAGHLWNGGLALRISVTDRCQLRCRYCLPPEGAALSKREDLLSYEEIAQLARALRDSFGLAKIRVTGGEPLVRPGLPRLVALLAALDVPDLALTTNGLLLAGRAETLRAAGLHRVNVSLDALDADIFRRVTRGGRVEDVLAGIRAARAAGLTPIKLNTVLVRGLNDGEIEPLAAFALENDCELRFIELMPIGPGAELYAAGHVPAAEARARLARRYDLEPLGRAPGASAERFRVRDADGRAGVVGFIAPCSAPFCADCRRLRVTADGRLLGCLAREGGIPVREALRDGDLRAILSAVPEAFSMKREDAAFAVPFACMAGIGG